MVMNRDSLNQCMTTFLKYKNHIIALCVCNAAQTAKRYRDHQHPYRNLILTQHFQMGLDGHRHKRNTNVLVIGGSGAGKSRSYHSSYMMST